MDCIEKFSLPCSSHCLFFFTLDQTHCSSFLCALHFPLLYSFITPPLSLTFLECHLPHPYESHAPRLQPPAMPCWFHGQGGVECSSQIHTIPSLEQGSVKELPGSCETSSRVSRRYGISCIQDAFTTISTYTPTVLLPFIASRCV
jgi:hypothetical protein